jgi:sporulation protein YlmC with PRC-barrel domain
MAEHQIERKIAMNGISDIISIKRLRGMVALDADTARKWGCVTDIVINPVKGTVMAPLFQTSAGDEYALAPEDFHIHNEANAVIAFGSPVTEQAELTRLLGSGARAEGELVGSDVVTNDGCLLGRVTEVFLQQEPMRAIYHITSSLWQRLFGGGLYLAGNAPFAFSHVGSRLIAPDDAQQQHAFRSLTELVNAWMREAAEA